MFASKGCRILSVETEQFLIQVRAGIDPVLRSRIPFDEGGVSDVVRYALFPGGKRLRPAVVFASGEVVSLEGEPLEKIACAAEFIHTASLIVDDLPCMDDSSERRGKRAVHVAFGEATAILASDALIVRAFGLCSGMAGVVQGLARAVGAEGMIGGQARDLRLKGGGRREEIEETERLKTAPLFRFSAEAPAIAAGAEPEIVSRLADYGETLGRLFQLTDDILDLADSRPNLARFVGRKEALDLARSLCAEAVMKADPLGQRGEALCLLARHILARTA